MQISDHHAKFAALSALGFGGAQINEALFEDLESALLMADAGVAATETLIADLKEDEDPTAGGALGGGAEKLGRA